MKKKTAIAAVCMTAFAFTAALVWASAQKVELVPCPIFYPDPNNPPPGGAFVIFNNPAGVNHNLTVTVSLKGVKPNTAYDLYLFVDAAWYNGDKIGTVTSDWLGNASFHMNSSLTPGAHILSFAVAEEGSLDDIYETPGIPHYPSDPVQGTLLIFN